MKNINSYYSIILINNFIDEKLYYIVMKLCDDFFLFMLKKGKLKI